MIIVVVSRRVNRATVAKCGKSCQNKLFGLTVALAQPADFEDRIPQNPDRRREQQAEAGETKFPDNPQQQHADQSNKKRLQQNTLDRADGWSWVESGHRVQPGIIASVTTMIRYRDPYD